MLERREKEVGEGEQEKKEEKEERVCACAAFAVEDAHERVACITAPRSSSIVKGSTC